MPSHRQREIDRSRESTPGLGSAWSSMDAPLPKPALRELPSVDELLLALKPRLDQLGWPRPVVRDALRAHLAELRSRLGDGEACELAHLRDARALEEALAP